MASLNACHNRTCCDTETVAVDQSPGARSIVKVGINGDIILEVSVLPRLLGWSSEKDIRYGFPPFPTEILIHLHPTIGALSIVNWVEDRDL